MVYGEVADSIQGARAPLYKRPRFARAAQWREYGERVTAFAQLHARRTACASRTTITWARTSSRRPTSTA